MNKPIVVVGSINIDIVAEVERIPSPGETLAGTSLRQFSGGKGANQAVAVARLGHAVTMVGNVGCDAFGPWLRKSLVSEGVAVDFVSTVESSSGLALINIAKDGQNAIVVAPGANGLLNVQCLSPLESLLSSAGMILLQLEIPFESVEFVANVAARNNVTVLLDPAPARPLSEALLQNVTWITPNETETISLLGLRDIELEYEAAQTCAEELRSRGAKNVIIKLGRKGCVIAAANTDPVIVPAFRANAVDTTAAGDVFNGAFAVGLVNGMPPLEAARFASAAAAISVTRRGAQASMPTLDEVKQFLASEKSLHITGVA